MLGFGPLGALALGELPDRSDVALSNALGFGPLPTSGPLGSLALGQVSVPSGVALGSVLELNLTVEAGAASGEIGAGNALAPGALLPLFLMFEAGAASGEGLFPPIVIGGFARPWRQDAVAPGALILLDLLLLPGRAIGVVTISAAARGAVLPLSVSLAAGTASGDSIGYDNDFLFLDIAA